MFDAFADFFFHEALHRSHDQRVDVRPFAADQALCALCLKLLLDLAEDQLYRVEFALVGKIEHPPDVELLHLGLRLLGLVHRQVVHEEANWFLAVSISDHLQVLDKLLDVDGLVEDPVLLDALLGGDAHEQRLRGLVEELLVDGHVLVFGCPLELHHRLPREDGLVDEDDFYAFFPDLCQLLPQLFLELW